MESRGPRQSHVLTLVICRRVKELIQTIHKLNFTFSERFLAFKYILNGSFNAFLKASYFYIFQETHDESTQKALKYFMDNYGVNGRQAPITAWAKFATLGVLSHNLHIERYHRTIKMVLKPNINLPCFCIGLIKINRFFKRKTILASEDIRGIGLSKSQKDYNGCHPNDSELYSVTKTSDGYLIAKAQPNGGISTYQLLKNEFRCNKAICKVYCNQCPSNETCVHDFSCNCRKYAYG